MKNERGLTLVELLVVVVLSSIILVLLISVFINVSKSANRSTTNQRLQQEANYITEVVRIEYLKPLDKVIAEGNNEKEITLTIVDGVLKMNGKAISEGYTYEIVTDKILRKGSRTFKLKIEKESIFFIINTKFSKLE